MLYKKTTKNNKNNAQTQLQNGKLLKYEESANPNTKQTMSRTFFLNTLKAIPECKDFPPFV